MPGSMSDADRDLLIKGIAPNKNDSLPTFLSKTEQMKAAANRLLDQSSFASSWMQKYGTTDGWTDQYKKYANENPLFDPATKEPIKSDSSLYLDPTYSKPKTSYSVDGQSVSQEQVDLMAKQSKMSTDQVISKYGLQKNN